ncbi:MAG: hypothetical protein CMG25_02375 [Candidatus Marinimicrobia bacterium]|nr:hypothetical protein [Candidatus Neomarinimicrobiota bacterium]|tara:strand:- start:680 stop:1546 length:867 start_codon:yes stop_codon:yes gene_type:complete
MFNCRLYLKIFSFILMICLISSCTNEITNNSDLQSLEIEDTYIQYDNVGMLTARVDFVVGSPINELLGVDVQFELPNGDIFKELLYDDGTNGDVEPNNGSYNLKKELILNNLIYDVSFFAYTENDTLIKLNQLVVGNYLPKINQVCMPELYTINEMESDTFYVYTSIIDTSGVDDIRSVKLELKRLQGYEIGSLQNGVCEWEESVDQDYIDYDIYLEVIPEYSLDSNCNLINGGIPNNYVYVTPLVIDSFSECGPHGPISFKYIVEDYSGNIDTSIRELLICHPGECE